MLENNDRLDLKLGVGINFGEVDFDYFGTSIALDKNLARSIGGYLEYTAIGDNVNSAQRLEKMANKLVADVPIIERCSRFRSISYTAPILMSRTVFRRIKNILKDRDEDYYKSIANFRGKYGASEIYEIRPDDLDWDYLSNELISIGLMYIDRNNLKANYWKEKTRTLEFPQELASKLLSRYVKEVGIDASV